MHGATSLEVAVIIGKIAELHEANDLIAADKYLTTRQKKESCGTFGAVANMFGKIRPVNQ